MSIQRSEYQPIFSYLKSLNFHFNETWVIECVNYYKSLNPDISLDTLKNEVKQQWLLVNLREIKVPCLPPDLKSQEKIILNGQYAVQVESMIDSSVSCYSQFRKLCSGHSEDSEASEATKTTKDRSNRCLVFVICDGVQEIKAMEYRPIEKIRTNDEELLPGFKMVILGPVECRRGMILLKNENVRICGGEVDTLTVTNSLKNILMRRLELDESDFPVTASPAREKEEEKENSQNQSHQTVIADDNFEGEYVQTLLSQNDDIFHSLPLESEILAQEDQTNKSLNEIDLFEDEDIWNDGAYEDYSVPNNTSTQSKKHILPQEEMETSQQKRQSLDLELRNNAPGSSINQNSSQVYENRDIFMDDYDEAHSEVTLYTEKTKKPVQTKVSSFFKNSETSSNRLCSGSTNSQNPVVTSNKPFVYLKQIKSVELSKPTIFMVKAIILTLKKKITIENDEFNLKVTITDGSSSVDVEFCSAILEDLLGFSPCEMAAMLKAKQTNSAISQRIKESFSKAQDKLISLNCLMEIKFTQDGKSPVVLSLEEVTMEHVKALKDRKLVQNL